MSAELDRLLRQQHGVVCAVDADQPWTVHNAARSGSIVLLFPGVYVEAQRRGEPYVRCRAAMRYLGGRGALSHTTALAVWRIGWDEPANAPIHVTVDPSVHVRGAKALIIHRSRTFHRQRRGGFAVTALDRTIIDSWPLLPAADRIGLVIEAAGQVPVHHLLTCLDATPKLAGAKELRRVLTLLRAGCHSPLELFGATHVFDGIPGLKRQVRVHNFRLDIYAAEQRVAFELDGAAFHGDQVQRERDIRRDAILATHGIQVVRFSYARLTTEPETVRREVIAILQARSLSR